MDYSLSIWSIASYVEANIKSEIVYEELESITGFSYRHIRSIMKKTTGLSLSNYILLRRISNAAFDLVHTNASITSIAYDYNFSNYNTFSRAFKRITNITPTEFRNGSFKVGHRKILMGLYAPEIYKDTDSTYTHSMILEDETMKRELVKSQNSCILFGVPKIAYCYEECTPLAMAVKSALNYLGDSVSYTHILNAMGASYRLRWNKDYWDGGNVDVLNIYEHQYDVIDKAFKACNRDYTLHIRSKSTKEEFIKIIKEEIDKGNPVISLGIIGPPEGGLITGYQDDGDTLLGWNVFQENKELSGPVSYHDCGYYITNSWWENPDTFAIITIGDVKEYGVTAKDIIGNGIKIMEGNNISVLNDDDVIRDNYACGQEAYKLWSKAITDKAQFSDDMIMPLKIEKLICQADAQVMIGEGRSYVAIYLENIFKDDTSMMTIVNEAARELKAIAGASHKMFEIRGGVFQSKEVLDNFMKESIREETSKLIDKAAKHEKRALELIREIYAKM